MGDALVRVQALDGQWETLGVDRLRGIVPEGINPTANPWGSDTLGFTIRRDPSAVWPDLTAFTPVEVFVKGVKRWSGFVWDSEQSQGEEIYNRVIVEGTGPDGSPLRVERTNPVMENEVDYSDVPTHSNPSFTTNTTGWTALSGATITRDTGVYGSAPASLRVTGGSAGVETTAFSGTWERGTRYRVRIYVAGYSGEADPLLRFYLDGVLVATGELFGGVSQGNFAALSVVVDGRGGTGAELEVFDQHGVGLYVDSLDVARVTSTLVDRRGFRRSKALQAQSAQTEDTAAELGDVWLRDHKTTPFRGLPSSEHKISVQCRGWPYHLDDDLYERFRVHTRLSDWKDHRSLVGAELGENGFGAAASTQTGDGAIVIGYPSGITVTSGLAAGVTLDLGPNASWKRIVVTTETVNGNAFATFAVRGHDQDTATGSGATSFEDAISVGMESLTNATRAGTFSTARRYVTIFLYRDDGGSGAVTDDHLVRITSIKAFADAAYESGNESALKASQGFADAIDWGTILLSSDRTGIQATTFSIPEDAREGYQTAREDIDKGNSYHGYQTKIDVEKRPIFEPLPSAPKYQVGNGSGVELDGNTLKATGEGAIRYVLGGQGVHPSELLTNTGELIRFAHLIDPDTGGIGRDGRIASVSYDDDKQEATVQIENDEANFDVFVTRWASLSPA